MAAPPAGKWTERGQNRRGKASGTEQFIAVPPSYPTVEAAAKASAKATRPGTRPPRLTFPAKVFLRVFYRFRSTATRILPKAWSIMGRQESAAGTSSPGIAATVSEILGYWKRSAAVGGGCVENQRSLPGS